MDGSNTSAIEDPGFVTRAASRFGDQCIVVGIDYQRQADGSQRVLVKQGTRTLMARIEQLHSSLDVNSGQHAAIAEPAQALRKNAVVRAQLRTERPILIDSYTLLPRTGSLILLEPGEFSTLAAGMPAASGIWADAVACWELGRLAHSAGEQPRSWLKTRCVR